MGTWRINLKLCEIADDLGKTLIKIHFKTLLDPYYSKMISSEDN